MKPWLFIKRLAAHTCVWFTFLEFVILTVAQGFLKSGGTSDMLTAFLNLKGAAYLLFSILLFEASGAVLRLKCLPGPAVNFIHFAVCALCAFIVLCIIPGNYGTAYTVVVFAIFTLVYIVLRFVFWGVSRFAKTHDEAGTDGSIFDEK